MSADDDMRDKHGLPPRHRRPEQGQPVNLAPIRAVVHVWQSAVDQGRQPVDLAEFASHAIPTLCDEIVRLRAALADQQVTPA